MKRTKTIILSVLSCLFVASCGGSNKPIEENPNQEVDYKSDSIVFHYHREDKKFDNWALWLWKFPSGEGKEYYFNGEDSYGAYATYPLSTWGINFDVNGSLGFIVKSKGSWSKKDVESDRTIELQNFEADEKGNFHIYLKSGDENIYTTPDWKISDAVLNCSFTSLRHIILETSNEFNSVRLLENGNAILEKNLANPSKGIRLMLPNAKNAKFDALYEVEINFVESKKTLKAVVNTYSLFKTSDFNSKYTYDGELGAIYTKENTIFRVWSPVSIEIELRIYNSGTPKSIHSTKGDDTIFKSIKMQKGERGVFETQVNGDLEGKYYTYVVTNSKYNKVEVVDPYTKSVGVNGLRGMIVDFDKTNPTGWEKVKPLALDRKQLTVYETHVADLTSSSTWSSNRQDLTYQHTFKGASLPGTTYKKDDKVVKTGFDHIKELGVNAVQLLPIFDQANDEIKTSFNWGYNPLNYNVLEGSYSTDPFDGYTRIKEFKELVQSYNEAGINIIMDVVYNHVNTALGSNFDVLMPGYYFRYDSKGNLSNGSGCGNETASEMPMFRKFMVDSTKFLASEYKLGGFRFDLMGLHDLDTMEQITTTCKTVFKDITIFGEPWTGGTSPLSESLSAKQVNGNKYKGYGAFNDQFRDSLIKGGLNGVNAKGWITNTGYQDHNDIKKLNAGIRGITLIDSLEIKDPDKTINYVTCHDNYTLYDRIKAAGITDEITIKKMAMLANSIVFTSQGTSFMLAGEEFLRTKHGDNNSYNSGYKINELDYSLKIKNEDMFKNYQKLIKLKQVTDGLHKNASELVQFDTIINDKNNLITYKFRDTKNAKMYYVAHSNGFVYEKKQELDFSGFELYLSTIDSYKILSKSTEISPYETIIGVKNI